jgi:phosphoglycolate phosphatase
MSYFFKSLFAKDDNNIKLVIFDFDGTLADTRKLIVEILRKHFATFNISFTTNLLKTLGNSPLRDYLSIAGIKKDLVNSVAKAIENDFVNEYERINLAKNFYSVKEIYCRKVIVSNNVTEFIERILEKIEVNFFDGVYGADHFTDKIHAIRNLCKKYKLSPKEIIYVGDKDEDVLVAREIGCYSVIVCNKIAWSSKEEVEKMKPDFMIKDLSGLHRVIQHINMSEIPII